MFAGTEGNLPLLIASSKFTISEGFATTTITYRDQETPVPDSNSVALVILPGHARKMAAKLQAMGYEAWYYEPAAGGHGYGKDHKQTAAFMAIGVAFMKEKIGWI